jgi:hypothetical protein
MTDSDMMMGDFGAQWFEVQFQTGKTGKEIQEPPVSWRMLRQKKNLTPQASDPPADSFDHSPALWVECLWVSLPLKRKGWKKRTDLETSMKWKDQPLLKLLSAHGGMRLKWHCFCQSHPLRPSQHLNPCACSEVITLAAPSLTHTHHINPYHGMRYEAFPPSDTLRSLPEGQWSVSGGIHPVFWRAIHSVTTCWCLW